MMTAREGRKEEGAVKMVMLSTVIVDVDEDDEAAWDAMETGKVRRGLLPDGLVSSSPSAIVSYYVADEHGGARPFQVVDTEEVL